MILEGEFLESIVSLSAVSRVQLKSRLVEICLLVGLILNNLMQQGLQLLLAHFSG